MGWTGCLADWQRLYADYCRHAGGGSGPLAFRGVLREPLRSGAAVSGLATVRWSCGDAHRSAREALDCADAHLAAVLADKKAAARQDTANDSVFLLKTGQRVTVHAPDGTRLVVTPEGKFAVAVTAEEPG